MEGLVFWVIVILVVGVLVYGLYWRRRRDREVVACINCGNRMTYRRFKERDGCVQCGSDLYEKVE